MRSYMVGFIGRPGKRGCIQQGTVMPPISIGFLVQNQGHAGASDSNPAMRSKAMSQCNKYG